MMYENMLMRLFGQMGRNPWQQYPMQMEPPQMWGPFEGGWQNPLLNTGKSRQSSMGAQNVPSLGQNAMRGMGRMY